MLDVALDCYFATSEDLARKDAELARKDVELARKDAELARKDAELAQCKVGGDYCTSDLGASDTHSDIAAC